VAQQCNNPKTKEPKLNAAMRIIAEWKDNDQEIKQLYDRVYKSPSATSTCLLQRQFFIRCSIVISVHIR
jgi:hypothetical protein